jgi:putative transcriptional regulator
MDYFNYQQIFTPKKGCFLVSEPFLPDPNFERTVILLCEHNEEGSIGFILNKPSILKFDEAVEDTHNFNAPLFIGGPVQQDTLHFIHRSKDQLEGSIQIGENIYWGGNYEQLIAIINSGEINKDNFKFFLGYSGWAPGQLEEELKQKSWIIYEEATEKSVFDINSKMLWKEILKGMGGKFKVFANYPVDPRMN